MNEALHRLAKEIGLQDQGPLRIAFAAACMDRVRHLLEEPQALQLLQRLDEAAAQGQGPEALAADAATATNVAR